MEQRDTRVYKRTAKAVLLSTGMVVFGVATLVGLFIAVHQSLVDLERVTALWQTLMLWVATGLVFAPGYRFSGHSGRAHRYAHAITQTLAWAAVGPGVVVLRQVDR